MEFGHFSRVVFYELPGNRVVENQITMRSRPRWPFKSQNFKSATQFVIYTYDTIAMKCQHTSRLKGSGNEIQFQG